MSFVIAYRLLPGFFDISDALFPPQFCSKFDIIKSIWVNLVLADEACKQCKRHIESATLIPLSLDFHSTLAISASYVDFFERKPGISSKTLYHISQAYALVNRKLSGPESVSDSAIAAVVTLAIYQQIHRLHSTGLIHLRGLYRMIQLRGGIARLMRENRALALKALRCVHLLAHIPLFIILPYSFEAASLTITRLDVELALQTGLPTLFSSDAVISVNGVLGDSCAIEEQLLSTTSRLSSVMLSVMSFASLLNGREREERTKLDPLSYTETLVWLLYRLVEVSPLRKHHSVSDGLDFDVAHLATLAFMTTLLPKYGRDDSNHPVADRLESTIQDLHVASTDTQDSGLSLLLWTLFIGGLSVLKGKDHRCLILETCKRLKLHDWPAIRRQLCGFPWIHTLHDLPGRRLWEDAQRRNIDIPHECIQLEA